jgi:hypothetical protein
VERLCSQLATILAAAAIEELSTPVVLVHEGILLLPLVGAFDAPRAEHVVEAVLERTAACSSLQEGILHGLAHVGRRIVAE